MDPAGRRYIAVIVGLRSLIHDLAALQLLLILLQRLQVVGVKPLLAGMSHTQLAPVIKAPTPYLAALGQQQREAIAGIDRQTISGQAINLYSSVLIAAKGPKTQLSMKVVAPGIDNSVSGQGHYMVTAGGDRYNVVQQVAILLTHLNRRALIRMGRTGHIDAQLAIFIVTPCPDSPVGLQRHTEALTHIYCRNRLIYSSSQCSCHGHLVQHLDPEDHGISSLLIQHLHRHDPRPLGYKCSPYSLKDLRIHAGNLDLEIFVIGDHIVRRYLQQPELRDLPLGHAQQLYLVAHIQLHTLGDVPLGAHVPLQSGYTGKEHLHRDIRTTFDHMSAVNGGHVTQLSVVISKEIRIRGILFVTAAPAKDPTNAVSGHGKVIPAGGRAGIEHRAHLLIHIGSFGAGLIRVGQTIPILAQHTQICSCGNSQLTLCVAAKGIELTADLTLVIGHTQNDHRVIPTGANGRSIGDENKALPRLISI